MREKTQQELERYYRYKIPTGSFLQAVLENNLIEAFARADVDNSRAMFEIVKYVYSHLPVCCYGSPEKVEAWLASKQD